MSHPTPPDHLAAAKRRLRIAVLRATMAAVGVKTHRQLIDVIIATFGMKRREVVTETHRLAIKERTIAGWTAAAIADAVGLSVPTVVSQRRKLGLVKHRVVPTVIERAEASELGAAVL